MIITWKKIHTILVLFFRQNDYKDLFQDAHETNNDINEQRIKEYESKSFNILLERFEKM